MTCRELVESILDYQDGALAPAERQSVEAHLSICPHCVKYLQSYEGTVRLTKATSQESDETTATDLPEEFIQNMLQQTCRRFKH